MDRIKILSCLLGIVSAAIISHQAFANTDVYIGANGGYITSDTKITLRGIPGREADGSINGGDRRKAGGHTGNVNLHFGAGTFMDATSSYYLGGEVTAGFSNLEMRDSRAILDAANKQNITLKQRYSFGIAARLGMLVNKAAMPFIKIGVATSKWNFQSNYSFAGVINRNAQRNKYIYGLVLGLGIDMPINERLTVGLEAVHTRYQRFRLLHPNVINDPTVSPNMLYTAKPQTNTVNLRFSWKI